MSAVRYLQALVLITAVAACGAPAELVFTNPFPAAAVHDAFGGRTLQIAAEAADGAPIAAGILLIELERGGKLGFPLNHRGEIELRFPQENPLVGRLWVYSAPASGVHEKEGAWRNRRIRGRVRISEKNPK